MTSHPIKLGVAGCGWAGRQAVLAATVVPRTTVVAIADLDAARREDVAEEFSVPHAHDDYSELLEDSEVEAVYLATPPDGRLRMVLDTLKSGKHVFCEKPPAFNAEEVAEVQEAEKASGKVLMYGFNHRHHESIQHMKKVIDSGEFGRVLWMRGRYGKSVDESFYNDWRSKKDLAGGGILIAI